MASPLKPLPSRLFELLEVQQEPFLLENGCLVRKGFNSKGAFWCWSLKNHDAFRRRRTKSVAILRRLFAKLLDGCFSEIRSKANAGGGFHRLSSASAGELSREIGWKEAEHSPVSVLELHSDESSSDHNNHSMEEENPTTSKCVSIKPRQLLYDFLKEMEDDDIFLPPWEKHQRGGDVAMLTHLLELDLSGTMRKWRQFDEEKREIGTKIGGMIFEEMRDGCVFDMLEGFSLYIQTS